MKMGEENIARAMSLSNREWDLKGEEYEAGSASEFLWGQ